MRFAKGRAGSLARGVSAIVRLLCVDRAKQPTRGWSFVTILLCILQFHWPSRHLVSTLPASAGASIATSIGLSASLRSRLHRDGPHAPSGDCKTCWDAFPWWCRSTGVTSPTKPKASLHAGCLASISIPNFTSSIFVIPPQSHPSRLPGLQSSLRIHTLFQAMNVCMISSFSQTLGHSPP